MKIASSIHLIALAGTALLALAAAPSRAHAAFVFTLTQTGATAYTFTVSSTLTLGSASTGNGTYNLASGTLAAGSVAGGSGTSTFDFNGGTLQAGAGTTTSLQGLKTANVQAGGASIDTNGYSVTINQQLQHDTTSGAPATDGGLTKNGAGTLTSSATSSTRAPTPTAVIASWRTIPRQTSL